ncbi:hypothetical protein [Acuticoccus sp.]|uniref:hypothetical protein n=1 Tax=Acuticoccus sp. TaxID=1904378 RepID=UPI003B51C9CE
MTACLYIRPKGVPAIISDMMVTWDGRELGSFIHPGTAMAWPVNMAANADQLYRKTYFIGDYLGIAAEGQEFQIKNLFFEIKQSIYLVSMQNSPIETLCELVNGYR